MVKVGELIVSIKIAGLKAFQNSLKKTQKTVKTFVKVTKDLFKGLAIAVVGAFALMAKSAADLQSALIGLQAVSKSTGRDFEDVRKTVKELQGELGFMATEAEVTAAVLRLLGTSLSLGQIKEFIKAIQDGAAAMGEDFATQLPLVIRGFKQLNPNVLDNIGANVRMIAVYKKASKQFNATKDELTDLQIEQTLLNEVLEKTSIFQGAAAAQTESLKGKMAALKTTIGDMAAELGEDAIPLLEDLISFINKNKQSIEAFGVIAISTFRELGVTIATVAGIVKNLAQSLGKLFKGDLKGAAKEAQEAIDVAKSGFIDFLLVLEDTKIKGEEVRAKYAELRNVIQETDRELNKLNLTHRERIDLLDKESTALETLLEQRREELKLLTASERASGINFGSVAKATGLAAFERDRDFLSGQRAARIENEERTLRESRERRGVLLE